MPLTKRSQQHHRGHRWLPVLFTISAFTFASVFQASVAAASTAYGVTETNTLIRFETSAPATVAVVGPITDLLPGEQILAIDIRPLTGRLYGVSASHLYLIDPASAVASLVAPDAFPVALTGAVGMDFDPVSGAIRVVTDSGQNLRVDPDSGAVTTDTATTTGLAGVAYSNNFAAPDRATLFAVNAATDQLVRIGGADLTDGGASQNGGTTTVIGPIGFDTDGNAGFDITANDNTAWATLAGAADTNSSLYGVNLPSGIGTLRGVIAAGAKVRSLAVLSRAVTLYGLTWNNAIVTFLSAVPGTLLPQPAGAAVAITGLAPGELMVSIDTRPLTGELFGLGNAGRLYTIDPATGQTTFVSQVSTAFSGAPVGFDFDPVADRVRITTDTGQNLVVNPTDGSATAQTVLSLPGTVALAYTPAGALFGIDSTSDRIVSFATPSTGTGALLGPIGADAGPLTGFDVSPADGTAFAAVTAPGGASTTLYTVSLPDGGVRSVGVIAGGAMVRGLAVASPGRVRLSATAYNVLESAGSALVSVERFGGTDGAINVRLQAAAGTATGPGDFVPGTFTIEFAPGETSKTVNVIVTPDALDEEGETVQLTLSAPQLGATLGTPTTATLTIADDDPSGGGAAPQVAIAAPTGDPTYEATSLFFTLAGTATDSDGQIASVTWVNDRGGSGTASVGAAAASVEWFANGVQLAAGVNTITVTATDNAGNLATDTIVVSVNQLSYYLAEGATGAFFDLDLLLANPHAVPVNVTATFLKPMGQGTIVQQYTLAPTSRRTINVETIPGLEGTEVSTVVTAPAGNPIVVERTMRWDDSGYGAHTDKASEGASLKWYFAEGSQGFFFTYLLLANPQNAANEATVRYLREGEAPLTRTYPLQALERLTVDLGQDDEIVNRSFGMEVTFQQPGIAERAMYFGLDPLWVGGHESAGVTLPSREWFLAEGATGPFFETYVLFANPTAQPATIAVNYLPSFGAPVVKEYTVEPGARLTVNVEQEDAALANAAVATQVTSTAPILVERAQYWADPTWYEAHNSFGVTSLGPRWGLAEGRVGGAGQFETYILLANTNTSQVNVTIDFLLENGTTIAKSFSIDPQSRLNVQVGVDVPEITEGGFGAVVTATQPIAVERAMYSNAGGQVWQAGTNATATPLPPIVVP